MDWQKAHMLLIFKEGQHSSPSNYGTASLTSLSKKICEGPYTRKYENKIISDIQHGLCKTDVV